MKVLQVCGRVPFPPADGGTLAVHNITHGLLKQGCEVKVFALNTNKHWVDTQRLPEAYQKQLKTVPVNTDVKVIPAFLNLLGRSSYNVSRFYSLEAEKSLKQLLEQESFDVVHIEGLFMSIYLPVIRKHSHAPVVMRAHNVEYEIWEHMAAHESNPLKRWYLKLLSRRLKRYECQVMNQFDAIVAITQLDADHYQKLGCSIPIHVSPFGVEVESLQRPQIKRDIASVFHLGAMDWLPNQEGVQWFLQEVWPAVYREFPQVSLYLAGRRLDEFLTNTLPDGVEIVGEVTDAYEFMAAKGIMIVPLSSGSGMRVKIIEGMAMGNTIIATPLGAEGIDHQDGENILIARAKEDFIDKLKACIQDQDFVNRIGRNAQKLVKEQYDIHVLAKGLVNLYQSLPA